jgi:hypothetical protein
MKAVKEKRPSDKRKSTRRRVTSAASVRVKDREYESLTRDISHGGIYVYSDAKITEGSEIEIVAMLPMEISPQKAGSWVCCHARVVRVENDPRAGRGIAAVIERFGVVPEA